VKFTAEQEALRSTVAQMARPALVESPTALTEGTAPSAWGALVDGSMLSLRSREDGAPVAGTLETALVAEPLGRYPSIDTPFVGTTLAIELLSLAGADEDLVESLATGRSRATVLLDSQLTDLVITHDDRVSGVAWDAGSAERAYLVREVPGGFAIGYVEVAGAPGSTAVDLTRPLVEVTDGAFHEVLSTPVSAAQLDAWTAFALTLVAADEIGIMHAAVDMMNEYAKVRQQFGTPVGSFQAVSHRIADAYVSLEGARSIVWYAAWAADNVDSDEALASARRAKAYTGTTARCVCEDMIQVLGGIGMTWEHTAHLYLRRAMLDRQTFGDEHHQFGALTAIMMKG
jgi:hypothetical protein